MSQRDRKVWQQKISDYLWLVVPVGVIALVLMLTLLSRQQEPNVTIKTLPPYPLRSSNATPTPSAVSPSMQGSTDSEELLEEFVVETPGDVLPDRSAATPLPGEKFPDLGQEHIAEGESVDYNSNPPTSGAHYEVWAKWGIYEKAPVDEQLVHNLEHGGVIVSYNPTLIRGKVLEQLRAQVRELSQINPRIILTPRDDFDGAIALTAWTYLQKLDRYDPDAIKTFYDAHIARGPECQKGQCPG